MLTLNLKIYSWGKCMSCYTSIHAHLTTNKNQNPLKMIFFLSRNETTLASCVYRHWNRHASRSTRKRNLRSKIWWFTEFCNSHYVSHFAAFFIVVGTKTSIAESSIWLSLLLFSDWGGLNNEMMGKITMWVKHSHDIWLNFKNFTEGRDP